MQFQSFYNDIIGVNTLFQFHGIDKRTTLSNNDALWILKYAHIEYENALRDTPYKVGTQRHFCYQVEHNRVLYNVDYDISNQYHIIYEYKLLDDIQPEEVAKTRKNLLEEHKDTIPMFL